MYIQASDSSEEFYAKIGRTFRAEAVATVTLSTAYLIGITTGVLPLRLLGRRYCTSLVPLTVNLSEAPWTGGTLCRTANRNFMVGGVPPAVFNQGVTGTPGVTITGQTLRDTTTIVDGGGTVLTLKPNTQYIVSISNPIITAASIEAYFEFREWRPEE